MSADAQRFFEEQGYLIVEDLLSDDELDACRHEIERLHALAAELDEAGKPEARQFQREPHAGVAQRDDGLPVLRKVENTGNYSDLFGDLARHSRLVPVIQGLIGDDLLLFRSTLMLKPAHHGSAHALHQDSAYWPMDPPTLVTVSIALNNATPENGCIQVIPGSHKSCYPMPHSVRTCNERAPIRHIPMRAGSVLFFLGGTVGHGAYRWEAESPRRTALFTYGHDGRHPFAWPESEL